MIPCIHKYINQFEIVKEFVTSIIIMASEEIDEITARYSVLQSLSASDLQGSLECNIHCTQEMWAQIVAEMSKLQEPTQQADQMNQAASLQERDQQLAEIMEEEMAH